MSSSKKQSRTQESRNSENSHNQLSNAKENGKTSPNSGTSSNRK